MSDLINIDEQNFIEVKEVKHMVESFKDFLPEYNRACKALGKRQSQFMDNMLTLSKPTPIRNLRQILSEITTAKEAIMENGFNLNESRIKVDILREKLDQETDPLKIKLIENKINKRLYQLENVKKYYVGAFKKLENYTKQYQMLCEKHDIAGWTEEDFEDEEERYHIMTAFDQALTAARSKGGLIDEGNHIYLNQIGINGSSAQHHVTMFLREEQECFRNGKEPKHQSVLNFLNAMAEKYKGCSKELQEKKGMSVQTSTALIGE